MIKLFSLKQKKKKKKKEEEGAGGSEGTSKKVSPAHLHIQKDINELRLPKECEIEFPDPDDLLHFTLVICPDEGFYKGGKFIFSFQVPGGDSNIRLHQAKTLLRRTNGLCLPLASYMAGGGYPYDPPEVRCQTRVYHPSIDLEGHVCLSLLRDDWKPLRTINSIVYALRFLFLEPSPEDPLNEEAAEVLLNNRGLYEKNVWRSMRGGYIGSTYYERCLR